MKVKQLIEKLKNIDPEKEVGIEYEAPFANGVPMTIVEGDVRVKETPSLVIIQAIN